jgi:hypothetical protein
MNTDLFLPPAVTCVQVVSVSLSLSMHSRFVADVDGGVISNMHAVQEQTTNSIPHQPCSFFR